MLTLALESDSSFISLTLPKEKGPEVISLLHDLVSIYSQVPPNPSCTCYTAVCYAAVMHNAT